MASATVHEAIALEINKDYNLDEILLRIGSVAPDSWRNVKNAVKARYLTHFWDFRVKTGQAYNYEEFYFKYYHKLTNPLCFGYLIHLITDQYWKAHVDPLYEIDENGVKKVKLKNGNWQVDENWFQYFDEIKMQKKLAKKYNLGYLPIEVEDLPNFSCDIDELNLSGLFGKDGTLNYINSQLTVSDSEEDSQIYDLNDILNYINETVEFIKKELQRLKSDYILLDKRFRIAVDIDDTLLSTRELEEYYWQIFLQNNPDINPNKEYKWGDLELARFWNEYREKMAFGKIKNGARECLNYLVEHDIIVDLLTARPLDKYAMLKKDLVLYFEENNLHYNYLHMGFYSKADFLKEHNYDLLIDNDIRNIREAEARGIKTILFGTYDSSYSGYQAQNWDEVRVILEKILVEKHL